MKKVSLIFSLILTTSLFGTNDDLDKNKKQKLDRLIKIEAILHQIRADQDNSDPICKKNSFIGNLILAGASGLTTWIALIPPHRHPYAPHRGIEKAEIRTLITAIVSLSFYYLGSIKSEEECLQLKNDRKTLKYLSQLMETELLHEQRILKQELIEQEN